VVNFLDHLGETDMETDIKTIPIGRCKALSAPMQLLTKKPVKA
jgi:hypothetical protein